MYTIYLDFDGTVVEHTYPELGRCNFGCIEVLHKLKLAGHKIILNTYRVELEGVDVCLKYLNEYAWMMLVDKSLEDEIDLSITEHTLVKYYPNPWDWKEMKANKTIYIDDITPKIPLKKACMVNNDMVDWQELDKQFKEHGLYE